MRGPSTIAPASAATPPIPCTTPLPAKSTTPCPRSSELAELAQPAPAPDPVSVQRVEERSAEETPENEGLELPALGHRPRGDRGGGVHECDHVEGEDHDPPSDRIPPWSPNLMSQSPIASL